MLGNEVVNIIGGLAGEPLEAWKKEGMLAGAKSFLWGVVKTPRNILAGVSGGTTKVVSFDNGCDY